MSDQIGVTGLAVMGANLARNLARHGHQVVLHNRSRARTDALVAAHGSEGDFVPTGSLEEFVGALERPRKIIIMVQAGMATDAVIDGEGRVEKAAYNVKATGHVAKLRRDLGLG